MEREPNSNLFQLLSLMAKKDEGLSTWLKGKITYTSPDNQNELIDIMGRMVLRDVIAEVKSSHYFTIMADESPDNANHEQAVFCLR